MRDDGWERERERRRGVEWQREYGGPNVWEKEKKIIIYQKSVRLYALHVYCSHKYVRRMNEAYRQEVSSTRYFHSCSARMRMHSAKTKNNHKCNNNNGSSRSGHLGHIKMQWCPGLQRAFTTRLIPIASAHAHGHGQAQLGRHTFFTLSCKFIVTVWVRVRARVCMCGYVVCIATLCGAYLYTISNFLQRTLFDRVHIMVYMLMLTAHGHIRFFLSFFSLVIDVCSTQLGKLPSLMLMLFLFLLFGHCRCCCRCCCRCALVLHYFYFLNQTNRNLCAATLYLVATTAKKKCFHFRLTNRQLKKN